MKESTAIQTEPNFIEVIRAADNAIRVVVKYIERAQMMTEEGAERERRKANDAIFAYQDLRNEWHGKVVEHRATRSLVLTSNPPQYYCSNTPDCYCHPCDWDGWTA